MAGPSRPPTPRTRPPSSAGTTTTTSPVSKRPTAPPSTWTYDAKTGYPTEIKDAEAVKNGTPGTVLTYQRQLNGYVADLYGAKTLFQACELRICEELKLPGGTR